MKIRTELRTNNLPGAYLVIEYENYEYEIIRNILENELKLKKKKTHNLFNQGLTAEFYQETDEELKRILFHTINNTQTRLAEEVPDYIRIIDDINADLVTPNHVNISIFRVIPQNNIVEIRLHKFLTIQELYVLAKTIRYVLKMLVNLAINKTIIISKKEE